MPQNMRITIGSETCRFTMQNTIAEDKLTNTFASKNKMTGDAPTARTGSATESSWTLCALVGPGKDTHGTPVPLRREAVGGPRHASSDTTKTTRPRFTAPRLGYQHGSGAGLLKPQIYEAATELGDKNNVHESTTDPGKTKPKSNIQTLSRYLMCKYEPILVTPSQTERQCHQ